MDKLHQLFPDFDFGDANKDDDIFLDDSQVVNIPLNLAISVISFGYIFDIFAPSISESIWDSRVFKIDDFFTTDS